LCRHVLVVYFAPRGTLMVLYLSLPRNILMVFVQYRATCVNVCSHVMLCSVRMLT